MNPILMALLSQQWAMEPDAYERLAAVVSRWSDGVRLSAEQIAAAVGEAPALAAQRREAAASAGGGVAVLPLYGVVAHRARMVQQVSGAGGTSTEMFGAALRQAVADPNVAAIVIDIDSPGGAVAGTPELADAIYAARASKPIVASANATAASAAYWIGSAASEFVATPSATVGSVGVIATHRYRSGPDKDGYATEHIYAGRYKAEGADAAFDDEARAYVQAIVDDAYSVMVRAIARNRGTSPEAVRREYGEGRAMNAQRALAAGMIDRIETFDETVARMANPRRRSRVAANANAIRIAHLS